MRAIPPIGALGLASLLLVVACGSSTSAPAAATQPNHIEGGVPGGGSSGDRHLLVVDRDRWLLFELFAHLFAQASDRTFSPAGLLADLQRRIALQAQLHELFMYLRHKGVLAISIMAQHGLVGPMQAPIDLSYLADNIVLFRFFEAAGRVRQAISVMKKRSGYHERTIRELRLQPGAIVVGEPLQEFHGVLTGVPTYVGNSGPFAAPTVTE